MTVFWQLFCSAVVFNFLFFAATRVFQGENLDFSPNLKNVAILVVCFVVAFTLVFQVVEPAYMELILGKS